MKEGFIISASWKFLTRSMLATLPTLGMDEPRAFYKKARAIYRREMRKLTEYGEGDVLKLNLAQAVMLGAVYEACDDPKPDIDTLTRFYHDFLTHSGILRKHIAKRDSTLATGGAVCDCHYVRKSAVTEAEREKSQSDKRAEALRGGRTVV